MITAETMLRPLWALTRSLQTAAKHSEECIRYQIFILVRLRLERGGESGWRAPPPATAASGVLPE